MLSPQQGNNTGYETCNKKLGLLIMLQVPVKIMKTP